MGRYLDLIAAPAASVQEGQKAEPCTGAIVEATLRPTIPWPELLATVKPANPGFPPCPECHQARYWISPKGKVVCGSRKCAGAVRFLLTAIEFHPVQ